MRELSFVLKMLSRRYALLLGLNFAFFSCAFITALVADSFPGFSWVDVSSLFAGRGEMGFFVTLASILAFNLVWVSFALITVPGLLFFPLSTVLLIYRAFLWGLLLHFQPTYFYPTILPLFCLEGEAYVLAAASGTLVGASWLNPKLLYRSEQLPRWKAMKKAFKEFFAFYMCTGVMLFFAAVLESYILTS